VTLRLWAQFLPGSAGREAGAAVLGAVAMGIFLWRPDSLAFEVVSSTDPIEVEPGGVYPIEIAFSAMPAGWYSPNRAIFFSAPCRT
jgi:hypothetical protein